MNSIEAIKIIREELPPDYYLVQNKIYEGMPETDFKNNFTEIKIELLKRDIDREDALKIFNNIRKKLSDFCDACFMEENYMEWVWHIHFKWHV